MYSMFGVSTEPTINHVVDDDLGVRESLTAMLQAVGLSVRCFASADEFLANHDGTRVDCLLLDVRMPGNVWSF